MDDKTNQFCLLCGETRPFLIRSLPKDCEYSRFGDRICINCCSKCDFFDGCAEVRYRIDKVLVRNPIRNRLFLDFCKCFEGANGH